MPSPTLREAGAALRRAPLLTGLSASMVALALFVVGLFAIATHNLRLALRSVEDRVEVVAYLQENTPASQIDAAVNEMTAYESVANVRFISKASAFDRAREEMPEIGDKAAGLDVNPFPASLEVQLAEGFTSPDEVEKVAELLGNYDFVEVTEYGEVWVGKLHTLRRIGGILAMVVGGAFAIVGALIIGSAIRIAIFARRDEIYIMRLVGARDSFIRRPFILEGAFTGVVGGLLATGLTWSTYRLVSHFLIPLEWVPGAWVVFGIMAGASFGMVASTIAVRRHLREV